MTGTAVKAVHSIEAGKADFPIEASRIDFFQIVREAKEKAARLTATNPAGDQAQEIGIIGQILIGHNT